MQENAGVPLTDDTYIPTWSKVIKEKDDEGKMQITGVTIYRESENVCKTEENEQVFYGVKLVVKCDADITGLATIASVATDNECVPVISVKHASGCPTVTATTAVNWVASNPIVIGIACIIIGAITAMCGKRWFPWIAAAYGALSAMESVIFTTSELGGMNSVLGIVLTLVLALVVAIIVGMLIRRFIWTAVAITGIVCGAEAGAMVFAMSLALTGWNSLLGFLIMVSTGAIMGGVIACNFAHELVLYGTSFLGSYIFMRGWTFFFGQFPSEVEMITKLYFDEEIRLALYFWIYVVVFVALFIFTS